MLGIPPLHIGADAGIEGTIRTKENVNLPLHASSACHQCRNCIFLHIYTIATKLRTNQHLRQEQDVISTMNRQQSKDPLHGITLEQIVNGLVEYYGWKELGEQIDIRCFNNDPSVKSSLKFLRRAPWARKQVEDLYLAVKRID